MLLSDITRNLNSEILTKNLVNFRRWDGIQDEKLKYYGNKYVFLKKKKQYTWGNCLIRGEGVWTVCRFKGGLGGGLIPQWHYAKLF